MRYVGLSSNTKPDKIGEQHVKFEMAAVRSLTLRLRELKNATVKTRLGGRGRRIDITIPDDQQMLRKTNLQRTRLFIGVVRTVEHLVYVDKIIIENIGVLSGISLHIFHKGIESRWLITTDENSKVVLREVFCRPTSINS